MPLHASTEYNEYWLKYAIERIKKDYGDIVSVDAKRKDLFKFGRIEGLDTTEETIQFGGGLFDPPAGNLVIKIKSDDASDTQEVYLEGFTISGSDLTFVSQTATLNGTNDVTLGTALHVVTRMENNGSTDFAGTVTAQQADNTVRLTTDGSNNQSLKCASAISSSDYFIVTGIIPSVQRQQTRSVDFKFQQKQVGKVWKTKFPFSGSSNAATTPVILNGPYPIVPKNHYFRVNGTSSGASTGASCVVLGVLAKVIGTVG